MAANNSKFLPELDERTFGRNQKTACPLYIDKLTVWLWQDNEGAARWTLILDDVLRRASMRTTAGLKNPVVHQSRLKHALVHAFAPHYPTTISLHPNTEVLDASGNIVPFGTNLIRVIVIEIVPEDTDGVTRAHLELLRQIKTFPVLQHGLNPLKPWCDRILLLSNDLGRLTVLIDQNQTICSHLDMLISSYGVPPSDPVSWNRCKDLLKSNTAYVVAPSVSLYMHHIKRFARDHVVSQKLLHERQAKKRGHFKDAYSIETLCWICGSASHDPRQCKMLTSALADYRSKHLYKGNSRGGGGFLNTPRGGLPSGSGGFTSRNNTLGGHHGVHKDKQFKNLNPEGKTVNFRHNGAHAANAVLPPPAYTPPLSENTMSAEEHFSFRATCEHEDKDMYNVYPTCAGATFIKDKTEDELKGIDYEIFASNAVLPPPAYTPPLSESTMSAEEHFPFRTTCEHEDKDMYNVYPTCAGATFIKDKTEDELKRIDYEIFGSEDSESEVSEPEDSYSVLGSPPICYDSSDDERSPTPQVPKLDPATRELLNAAAETTNIDNKDPLTQPEPNDDPNLNVTFSDEEEDHSAPATNVLPFPKYFLHLGWETKFGFHDYIPLDSAVYDIEDVKISIKGPLILATITDHCAYYFLTQVKDDLASLDDEIKSSKYLYPEGIAEIHLELGLLSSKIMDYVTVGSIPGMGSIPNLPRSRFFLMTEATTLAPATTLARSNKRARRHSDRATRG